MRSFTWKKCNLQSKITTVIICLFKSSVVSYRFIVFTIIIGSIIVGHHWYSIFDLYLGVLFAPIQSVMSDAVLYQSIVYFWKVIIVSITVLSEIKTYPEDFQAQGTCKPFKPKNLWNLDFRIHPNPFISIKVEFGSDKIFKLSVDRLNLTRLVLNQIVL